MKIRTLVLGLFGAGVGRLLAQAAAETPDSGADPAHLSFPHQSILVVNPGTSATANDQPYAIIGGVVVNADSITVNERGGTLAAKGRVFIKAKNGSVKRSGAVIDLSDNQLYFLSPAGITSVPREPRPQPVAVKWPRLLPSSN